jgi:hypothetical protein
MSNAKKVIELLKELEVNTSFDVYLPSLQKEVKFKQLTTEQLKRILRTALITTGYNSEFILTFNNIIKENCLDKTVNTDNLTIYDKVFITYKTKIDSISPDYNFAFTDDEISTYSLKESNKTISLIEIFNEFVDSKINFEPDTVSYNGCTITCNIPSLATENKLESELHKNISIDLESENEVSKVISEAFINEVAKFVTSINVNGEDANFLQLSFTERIKLIENLPVTLTSFILKYIENYKKAIDPLLSYTFVTDKNETFSKDITLDPTFFNI